MEILIKEIISEIAENKFLVKARHENEELEVYVVDRYDFILANFNKEIHFEIDYDEIIDWKIINVFNEEVSGLFSMKGNIIVRGEIHNYIEMDNDVIIDIYIRNGPEFISILSSEINGFTPKGQEGIELEIKGLCIYPVH